MAELRGDTEAMVQAALSKLGANYVWGATGPDVFDCSGLTQWSAGKAGYKISRTTYTQVNDGTPVVGDPQRGDLVFPEAGHVGIALGGDQMVHAPETGDVVKISKYWTKPYAIRRLGPNSGNPGSTSTSGNFGASSATDVNNILGGSDSTIGKIYDVVKGFAAFATALGSGNLWRRVAMGFAGGILMLVGIGFLGYTTLFGSDVPGQLAGQATSISKAVGK